MSIGGGLIREANKFIDGVATKKVKDFNQPSFGEGPMGTLHGERSDADGYKFLRIKLFGAPLVKTVKGCRLEFKNDSGSIVCNSDTKDIESVYSHTLVKGITEFEIYLDDELHKSLKKSINSVSITFPKKLFGKDVYSFEIKHKSFSKLMQK